MSSFPFGQIKPTNPTPPATAAPAVKGLSQSAALEKYAACVSENPDYNVTLRLAREVRDRLAAEGFSMDGGGIFANPHKSGATEVVMIPESDLIADGFPVDVALHFVIAGNLSRGNYHDVWQLKKRLDGNWFWIWKYVTFFWW